MTEFNIDVAREVWQDEAREEGREEGIAAGTSKVISLLESGHSLEEVKELLNNERKGNDDSPNT